jgi:hypothetical protein
MAGSPVPNVETELVPWLGNFSAKLSNYAATLDLSPAQVTQTQDEIAYLVYLLNERIPLERQTLAATLEFKNFMKDGDASASLPATLPGTTAPPVYPAAVLPGIMGRLRKLVQNIKTRPGYTETIGQDLGILAGTTTSLPESPTLTLISAIAGGVQLNWNKGGWTGVKVQGRINGNPWGDLGVDLYSPFVDTRALTTPGQAEAREYRACYLDGDDAQTSFSQVLEVTVTP